MGVISSCCSDYCFGCELEGLGVGEGDGGGLFPWDGDTVVGAEAGEGWAEEGGLGCHGHGELRELGFKFWVKSWEMGKKKKKKKEEDDDEMKKMKMVKKMKMRKKKIMKFFFGEKLEP